MRLLVIQHEPDKGLGLLEAPLREAGAELDICFAGQDPLELTGHAGVIALPGVANPVDDTEAVSATRSALRAALDRDLPTLGICLGAELLAEAANSRTARCQAEYGFWPVELTDDAAHDALLAGLPPRFEAFQAHGFSAELPEGAVALAQSERALQAFRLGEHAWGLQFHPEASKQMIAYWLLTLGHVMEREGADLPEIEAQARREVSVSSMRAAGIARRFVGAVRSAGGDGTATGKGKDRNGGNTREQAHPRHRGADR